jgi:hypothetical protein
VWEKGNSLVTGKNGTHSGTTAWVTSIAGNYLSNAVCALYTPNYDFSILDFYAIKFWAKYDVELNYDGFRVEYSTNLGASWSPLGTTVQAGWYNYSNTSASAFPTNQAFFSANVPAYTLYGRDISFLAGNANVAFRFMFKSDGNAEAAGIAIDDIEVTGPGNTWNGNVSDVWTNPLNWDGFIVPGISSNVIIPTTATNMPKLYASTEIKKLTLKTGASLNVNTGFVLKLNGQN